MLIKPSVKILIAEDDEDHYFLTERVLREFIPSVSLTRAVDGEELMDLLLRPYALANGGDDQRPNLVILDINMPRKDGWEVLREIKKVPSLCQIPIVVLSTSDVEEHKERSYAMGASSYIRKPVELKKWMETFEIFIRYWFETVELPNGLIRRS